jgi:hypothetical protein
MEKIKAFFRVVFQIVFWLWIAVMVNDWLSKPKDPTNREVLDAIYQLNQKIDRLSDKQWDTNYEVEEIKKKVRDIHYKIGA